VTGDWRKLHNEGLHNLYSSPSVIRTMKSRKMRWTGNGAPIVRKKINIEYLWDSQKEGDHLEDQDVGVWIIVKWILE
jgi:hypothetical protein